MNAFFIACGLMEKLITKKNHLKDGFKIVRT